MPHSPRPNGRPPLCRLNDAGGRTRPSPDYDVSRWLYVPNTYSEYRVLGCRGSHP